MFLYVCVGVIGSVVSVLRIVVYCGVYMCVSVFLGFIMECVMVGRSLFVCCVFIILTCIIYFWY